MTPVLPPNHRLRVPVPPKPHGKEAHCFVCNKTFRKSEDLLEHRQLDANGKWTCA